jgi:hypothetical protein
MFFIKICIVISLVNKFLLSCLIIDLTMLNGELKSCLTKGYTIICFAKRKTRFSLCF